MTLFPFTRPKVGLYVTADSLCVAHVSRRFGHQSFGRYVEQPLPSGSIRLSPVEPNILEREQVIDSLQAVFGHPKGPQSVALCLPDLCARTTIVEMATLPLQSKEQQALVEWRVQQDLRLSKQKFRISYQIFSSPSGGLSGSPPTDQPVRLLATAIQENIIEAYEAMCLEVGLVPASIHLASLAVFNMCRSLIDTTLNTSAERISFVPDTQFFLDLADWGYSIIVMRHQAPIFLRVKPLRHMSQLSAPVSQPIDALDQQNQGNADVPGDGKQEPACAREPDAGLHSSPPIARTLTNELIGTLQYYFETHEASIHTDEVYPLFLMGSPDPDNALPLITELIQQEFPFEADHGTPRIKAFPIFPGNTNLNLKPLSGLPAWTSTSLPAFAATSQSA